MDIRNEITNGNLMLAIKELGTYGVPEREWKPLLRRHNDRYELEITGAMNDGVTYYSYNSIREEAFKLLDKYAPPTKPLHERTASLLKAHKSSDEQNHYFLIDGRPNNDLETDSLETVERMVACWNAFKGMPTENIPRVLSPGAYYMAIKEKQEAMTNKVVQDIKDLVATIRPIFNQWDRQKGLSPALKGDGWVDQGLDKTIRDIWCLIHKIGLGDMLTGPEKPPMQKFYFTLGQIHEHPIVVAPGHIEMWDKNSVLVVEAETSDAALDLVIGKFGDTWSHQHSTMDDETMDQFFPGGFIHPDKQWMTFKRT